MTSLSAGQVVHALVTQKQEPEAFFGLPKCVAYCSTCTISNQRPNSCTEFKHDKNSKKETISFNDDNVCDACVFAKKKATVTDWEAREKILWEVCNKHRSTDGSYDCIVPSSGGKDSTMAAVLLKNKFGMHPLTVTWAPHIYTEVGFRNFQHCIHAGFDNQLFTPNGKVHRLLTRLAITNLLHPFQPFILGQKNLGAKMSLLYKIPLVFYGENEAEYGNPVKDNESGQRDAKYHSANENQYMDMTLGGVTVRDLISDYGIEMVDLLPYLPCPAAAVQKLGMEVHYMGYYIRWDPQEAYYFSVENSGFEANPERTEGTHSKYNSLDDRIDGFHYWTTYVKFGIGRATYDTAQEIRNKKITREEGIMLVDKYDGEFPHKYFDEILEYLDMTREEWFENSDKFRSPHLWRFDEEKKCWILKHTILGKEKVCPSTKYRDPNFEYKSNRKLLKYPKLFESE